MADVTASMTPEVIGPLFAQGRLLDCRLEGPIAVWDWRGGLRLTLDTEANHFHLERRHESDEAILERSRGR